MSDVLDLDFMKAFVESEAEGSFSKAARRLGRSQSVVSERIAAAEGVLGYPLFHRGRTLRITERGRELLPRAKLVLEHYGHFARDAESLAHTETGTLHMGVDLGLTPAMIATHLEAFAQAFPRVDLQIETLTSFDTAWFFRHSGMSMALVFKDSTTAQFEETQIATIPMVLVAAKTHPVAQSAPDGIVSLETLREHRQIVITARDPDAPPPLIVSSRFWSINSGTHALSLAARGLGWAVLSRRVLAANPAWAKAVTVLDSVLPLPKDRLVLESSLEKVNPTFFAWWRHALLKWGKTWRPADPQPASQGP